MLPDDSSSDRDSSADHYWVAKFRCALRGAKLGIRGQSSFFVHLFAAAAVVVAGIVLQVTRVEWCLLVICIASVLTAEMFNSALESMAKAITNEPDPHLGGSLDIGSAAVLLASIGAVVVGTIIFLDRLLKLVGWWPG
jgi:diacylglycerol kinase